MGEPTFPTFARPANRNNERHASDPVAGVHGVLLLLSARITPEHPVIPRWRPVGSTVETVLDDHAISFHVREREGSGNRRRSCERCGASAFERACEQLLMSPTAQKILRDLKSKISSQSKKNFVLEKDVRYLDSRIALLIQNRMALEEVGRADYHPRSTDLHRTAKRSGEPSRGCGRSTRGILSKRREDPEVWEPTLPPSIRTATHRAPVPTGHHGGDRLATADGHVYNLWKPI